MSAGTMPGLSTEAQKLIDSEAYADFVACEVEGLSRKQRADQSGKTPSTVSASIKRIQTAIDDGTLPDPRTPGSPTAGARGPGYRVDRLGIAEKQMDGASMFVEQMDRLDDEHDRLTKRIDAMNTQMDDLGEKRDKIRALAERAGFQWDEFETAVADAQGS